jgi:hypothetical protein
MSNIILTTPDEFRAIVSETVSGVMPKQTSSNNQIDTLTLNDVLELLREHGYPTSKAKIYKLTSAGTIPWNNPLQDVSLFPQTAKIITLF